MKIPIDPRIILAPASATRKARFIELARQSRAFHKGWVQPPVSEAKFHEYIKQTRRKSSKSYFIFERKTEQLVGVVNISQIVRGFFQSAYIGYYIFSPFANKGYMSEALGLAVNQAFSKLKLHRLEANIQPANIPSKKAIKNLGFRLEGYSPRYLQVDGRWRDHERWAITVEDWEKNA